MDYSLGVPEARVPTQGVEGCACEGSGEGPSCLRRLLVAARTPRLVAAPLQSWSPSSRGLFLPSWSSSPLSFKDTPAKLRAHLGDPGRSHLQRCFFQMRSHHRATALLPHILSKQPLFALMGLVSICSTCLCSSSGRIGPAFPGGGCSAPSIPFRTFVRVCRQGGDMSRWQNMAAVEGRT